MDMIAASLASLPAYLSFAGSMLCLLLAFISLYIAFTPYRELALIRQGNTTAAVSLGGTVIGLSLPLASIAAHTTRLSELLAWGIVALVSQLTVFLVVSRLLLRDFRAGLEEDRLAYGILLASASIAMGLLNYGSLTG